MGLALKPIKRLLPNCGIVICNQCLLSQRFRSQNSVPIYKGEFNLDEKGIIAGSELEANWIVVHRLTNRVSHLWPTPSR